MSLLDAFMLGLFVLFLIFMLRGMTRQILKRDEIRTNLKKDKK